MSIVDIFLIFLNNFHLACSRHSVSKHRREEKHGQKEEGLGRGKGNALPKPPSFYPLVSWRRCLLTERLKQAYFHLSIYTNVNQLFRALFLKYWRTVILFLFWGIIVIVIISIEHKWGTKLSHISFITAHCLLATCMIKQHWTHKRICCFHHISKY